jgi:UDP-galactopyranose mutase
MVGPLAKIAETDLPQAANVHWLGAKSYAELPAYLSGWDVAIMPFALNEATRYISPTKTPEYLSGGRPVVSTPINDVVHPYGDQRLVHIAADTPGFVAAISAALACDRIDLMSRADHLLSTQSWDATWDAMQKAATELQLQAAPGLEPIAPWTANVGNSAPTFARLSGSATTARPR